MASQGTHGSLRSAERGSALIVALALIIALTILVAATQLQVVSELKTSKTERDYERALQMAEAGANAYLNLLNKGAGGPLIPQRYVLSTLLTTNQFRQQAKNGTIPSANLIYYPPGQTRQGYFAAELVTGGQRDVVAYGWSNGVVRRVRFRTYPTTAFDWAALWGMNPNDAWRVTGDASVVGAAGGEGPMEYGNNNQFYDGPLLLCTPAARWVDANGNNIAPAPLQSLPDVPRGHVGTGVMARPWVRRYARPLGFPTADQAANEWALERYGVTTNAGVEYFRSNNDNATGLRYLVWKKGDTSTIRELRPGPDPLDPKKVYPDYSVVSPTSPRLRANKEWNPKAADLTTWGMRPGESFYGIRMYPGTYFLEQIDMGPSDCLSLRTFNDADRTDPTVVAQRQLVVVGDPANPNPGMAEERNIRVFIGHAKTGGDVESRFERGTTMEYPRWASRFRVFDASEGEVQVRGSTSGPPFQFNVNMLAYNRRPNGSGYGNVTFTSGVYLRGSLIAWHVEVAGGTVIEKQAPELGPDDPMAVLALDWRELP